MDVSISVKRKDVKLRLCSCKMHLMGYPPRQILPIILGVATPNHFRKSLICFFDSEVPPKWKNTEFSTTQLKGHLVPDFTIGSSCQLLSRCLIKPENSISDTKYACELCCTLNINAVPNSLYKNTFPVYPEKLW